MRQAYEYIELRDYEVENLEEELNKLGHDGWKLHSTYLDKLKTEDKVEYIRSWLMERPHQVEGVQP